ncbi:MAG: bifunctional oligoribonuclease/PAP phosphatase NrnA [Deltaproteobacteria bacterium]|nr:bifunctional oligoribonuclease/PAP phosphatase NrnA [Deltaproteobacteria bacterium]
MNQIIDHLLKSKHVFLASHINPDGDAVGSLIAMGLAVGALNKNVTLYNENSLPAVYRFLPSANRIVRHANAPDDYDTAVILDCGSLKRIGHIHSVISRVPVVINIDHHITNTGFGNLNLIDTSASATAEIVYRLIRRMGIMISRSMALSIYTGILTDTGSFRFANTSRAAFDICSEMMELGVDPHDVAQHVYGTYSLGRIKLLNLAIDSIEISENGKLSVMTLCQSMLDETGTHAEDIDGFIHYAKRIEDIKIAVLIRELSGKKNKRPGSRCHVSLRSDGTIDVSEIAATFGGGGHFNAAGFNIDSGIVDLKKRIFELARTI